MKHKTKMAEYTRSLRQTAAVPHFIPQPSEIVELMMEKHFISEDDIQLLGVFMGIKEIELPYDMFASPDGTCYKIIYADYPTRAYDERGLLTIDFLSKQQFDTSWLWLMPVVEKILSLERHYDNEPSDVWHQVYLRTFGMRSENTGCFMVRFDGCVMFTSETLLRATLSACLDFIKIYNNCSDSFRACQKIN